MSGTTNELQQGLMKYVIREADPILRKKLLKHKLKMKTSLLQQSRTSKEFQATEIDEQGRTMYKFEANLVPKDLAPSVSTLIQSKMTNKKSLDGLLNELGVTFEELGELLGIKKDAMAALEPTVRPLSASIQSRETSSVLLSPE